jgi:hypothetical protein
MTTCATCGQEVSRAFQISTYGDGLVFDTFECAIRRLAPQCPTCGCSILGHGFQSQDGLYCSFGCADEARRLDRSVDLASATSFPASDPPAFTSSPPIAADPRRELRLRREGGRIGWVLLWLLGIPVPLLLVLFLARGCT